MLGAALTAHPQLAAEPFTTKIMQRIDRAAYSRLVLLRAGYAAAGALVIVNLPGAAAAWAAMTPALLAGAMALAAVCSMVWMATVN